MENLATIGELAGKYDLTHRTVRFWEQKGLVRPVPTDSHRRHYTQSEVTYVGELVRLKKCLFSLHSMKFWRGAGLSVKRKLLEQQRAENNRKISELHQAQDEVSKMLVEISQQEVTSRLAR